MIVRESTASQRTRLNPAESTHPTDASLSAREGGLDARARPETSVAFDELPVLVRSTEVNYASQTCAIGFVCWIRSLLAFQTIVLYTGNSSLSTCSGKRQNEILLENDVIDYGS